jgi:hypothetical protein
MTNIVAGTDLGAALSDDDVAGGDECTVCLLNAKALRLAVTTVLSRTYTLLMCEKL